MTGINADYVESRRAVLAEQRLQAYEQLFRIELERGQHAAVVVELTALVDADPTHEHFAGLLMLALYRSGRRAQALKVSQSLRLILVERIGLDPGPALRDLELAILRSDRSLDREVKTTIDFVGR